MYKRNVDYSGNATINIYLQDLNPPPFVELYVVDFNSALGYSGNSRPVLYLANERINFTYDSQVYRPSPIEFDNEPLEINKPIMQPKLKLSSLDSEVINAVKSYQILTGTSILRITTLSIFDDAQRANYLTNPSVYNLANEAIIESWYVEHLISRTFSEVVFQLGATLGLGNKPALKAITGVELIGNC